MEIHPEMNIITLGPPRPPEKPARNKTNLDLWRKISWQKKADTVHLPTFIRELKQECNIK